MMTTTLQMTKDETEIYDNGTPGEQDELMRDLRKRARELGDYIEIYTADGIVAEIVDSRE